MGRPRKLPAGLVRRGKTYHCNIRAGGRRIRKRLSSDLDSAITLLNELRSRADKADFNLLDNSYSWSTLKAEFVAWVKQTKRPRVAEEYERDLERFESFSPIRAIGNLHPENVFAFRKWRLEGGGRKDGKPVTPRTINRQVGTVINMLNKGVEWKRIGSNPLESIQPLAHDSPKKERRALVAAEILALFEASPAYLKPVWRMFACTGIRKAELIAMAFDDIDFASKTATVRAVNAKTHKAREIPLDDVMLAMLAHLRGDAKNRQPVTGNSPAETAAQAANFSRDHVFVTRANTPWRNNLLKRFYAVCKRAGITDAHHGGAVDVHSLRVTFTTLTLENGANPRAIQAILGHSTLAMTMAVYAKATERSKREAINVLPFAGVNPPDHLIVVQNGHELATSNSRGAQPLRMKGTA